MSGHSKWATTKHQKAATDKKRSNLFTKLANLISVAARSGGDPTMNFSLRLAIDKAKAANMPKENIDRAIKRGTGELGGQRVEEELYEVYGPSGTAILIEATTDNKNRAVAEIKSVLNKSSSKLASSGSVAYLFTRKGVIKASGDQGEEAELKIIDSGADDYEKIEGGYLIYTKMENLRSVSDALANAGFEIESAELSWEPKDTVTLSDEESEKVIKLLESLDDLDDVSSVSSNLG